MKFRFPILALVICMIAAIVIGCGPTPTPTPRPVTPLPTIAPTQPPPPPTATSVPPTATPTPVPPQATAKQIINLRAGPSDKFALAGKMPKDTSAVVIGKSADATWLQLAYPDPEHPSWVLASFVNVTGALDPVAVIVPTATPTRAPGTPAAPKVATTTRTATLPPIPAAKGIIGLVSFDSVNQTFNLNNFNVTTPNTAPFQQMGIQPGDITNSTNAAPFAWARNGSRIAYVFGPQGATDFLRVTDGSGTLLTSFGHKDIFSPSFSPDSRNLIYVGTETNGAQSLFVIDVDNKKREFFPARESAGLRESFRGVAWGKWIYFVSNLTGAFEIWRMFEDGSGPTQLTSDRRENGSPAGSPDGTRLAYYSKQADNSYQIMIANADGSGARKLTTSGNNFTPVWSPDGNWIAYFSSTLGDILVIDKNGNQNQHLTKCQPSQRCQLPGAWR